MRLRRPHIAVRKTPPLFLVFPSRHQGSRSPRFCQARSLSPGLTTLTMKRVSRFNESKGLPAHIQRLQQREPMQQLTAIPVLRMVLCITTGFAATNSAGDSPYSNEVSGTTPLAKPTAATATAVSSSQINLTWIDNSASETGYKIERKRLLGGTYSQIAQVGANVQSYTDTTGLDPNTKYYYRIRATNGTLNSDYSNEPSATTFP